MGDAKSDRWRGWALMCGAMCLLCGEAHAANPPVVGAEPPAAGVEAEGEDAADGTAGWEPGWGPAALAVLPGILVHGTGHWLAGESETGWTLFWYELAGIGAVLAGGTSLILSGASRDLVGPSIAVTLVGVGLFTQSWLADVHGSAGGSPGRAATQLPWVQLELGYRYVYDPQFEYANFSRLRVDAQLGEWRVASTAWLAMDDDNQRARLLGAWRAFGPEGGAGQAETGSFLDVEAATTMHHHGSEGFWVWTLEATARGRYDLGGIGPTLAGAFAEMSLGLGGELYTYDLPDLGFAEDTRSLLLMRFGYGFYLGDGDGELLVYYDHRHDDYAAGLGTTGIAGGIAGHFGVETQLYLSRSWGFLASFEVGSAYLGGVSALYRYGGEG